MAVRSALGAGRARLVRQMLTESLVLSFLGAPLGLALAYLGFRSLSAIHGVSISLLHTVRMDGTAMLFTALAALGTGLLFGIVPALQTSGSQESEALKDTGRGMSEGESNDSVELVVRTKLPPKSVASDVRAAMRSIEPALPTAEYQELGELVDRAVSPRRFMVTFLAAFALAALLLASVGIFGVVSYTVSQRTREIGIRMALGASTGQVQRHVMAQTIVLVSAGILAGVTGAVVLARLMAAILYDLAPTDLLTFVATIVVLLAVAMTAGYLPALRASQVDPMSALRTN